MRARLLLSAVVVFALLGTGSQAQTLTDSNFSVAPYRTGFSQPTGFTFLPDNSLFVIEKASGLVRHVTSAGTAPSTALDLGVNSNSERGLLGIALDPNFTTNGFTYLYYSVNGTGADSGAEPGWTENRVSRFTWNGTTLGLEQPLASFPRDPNQSNGPNHDGGPLFFGPDGKLYGVTGDLNRSRLEQNQPSPPAPVPAAVAGVGGMFRINSDGSLPSGPGQTPNPFASNANASVQKLFAYGIRNSFGLAVDPITHKIWDTENGPNVYDEINVVQSGFNSGWNVIMGPAARSGHTTADLQMLPGATYSDPKFSMLNPIGITDMEFLANFKSDYRYRDAVIFGDNNLGQLHMLRLNSARDGFNLSGSLADQVADSPAELDTVKFGTGFGTTTDIKIGPDGAIYVLSLTAGAVYRITSANTNFLLGDMNGDGRLDNFDIEPFELALTDLAAYQATYPALTDFNSRGDMNADGRLDNFDIERFQQSLTTGLSPAAAVPEPSSMVLLALGGFGLALARRRRKK